MAEPLSLRQLVQAHPDRFYPSTWWHAEPFADYVPEGGPMPRLWSLGRYAPHSYDTYMPVATLVAAYLANPIDPRWRSFVWADTHDQYGNRVYVGGIGRYGIDTFQIHRHLADPQALEVLVP